MSATAEPDEPLPATADVSPHADEASPPPARFDVLNAVRVVVGAFGLAGFVLGAIVAWRSASATTLLIVSAVLLVLAALGLDWNKIRGTYGGWTVELLRDFGERIEQVADKAAIEEVTPALREELETLRAEVKALAPKAPPRRSSQGSSFNFDAMIRELFRTKATHSFRGTDAVELTLRHGTLGRALQMLGNDADRQRVHRFTAAVCGQLHRSPDALVAVPGRVRGVGAARPRALHSRMADGPARSRCRGCSRPRTCSGRHASGRNTFVHDPRKADGCG